MRIVRVFGKVHRGWSLSLADQLLSLDPIWPGDELIGNWPAGKFWGRPHTPSRWIFYHSCQSNAVTYTYRYITMMPDFVRLWINLYSWISISPGHHVFPIILHELPIKCEKDFSSVTCGNYHIVRTQRSAKQELQKIISLHSPHVNMKTRSL